VIRLILALILLLLLTNCSVDTKSGFLKNKKESKIIKKISDIRFDYDLSFNQFKENAIEYGKLSNYPKLDK
jgi:hypothetical protein